MRSRNFVIGGLVIGFVALCACGLALAGVAGALYFYQSSRVETLPTPAGTPDPEQVSAEMDVITQQVIVMRGLQPTGPVERLFLTPEEIRQRTIEDFEEDTTPEEEKDTVRTLAAVGLLAPDFDLYDLLIRLYSEGVAGQYDPDTKELIVVSEAGRLNAYEQTTFAHEYNHALQDQHYDIRGMGFSEAGFETDSEKAVAVQALLEGDATLLEEQYKETLSAAEKREYDRVLDSIDISIYFEVPNYLLNDFFFPYNQGLEFVRRYYDEGGWARVDEVWRNPPVSTEQIIHPERYDAGDAPLLVARPALTDTLGAGWRQSDAGTWGEWYTYLVLAYGRDSDTRLAEQAAYQAAEGWGGDSYVAFYNDEAEQIVFGLHWVWDTQEDADKFVGAFQDYGDRRFGSAQAADDRFCWQAEELHCLYFNGSHTLWLIAPDRNTMDAVLGQYPELK